MTKEQEAKRVLLFGAEIGLFVLALTACFDPQTKFEIKKKQKGRCADCNRKEAYLPVHHKVPQCLGGSDNAVNAVALCGSCHLKWDNLAMREHIIFPGIPMNQADPAQFKRKK